MSHSHNKPNMNPNPNPAVDAAGGEPAMNPPEKKKGFFKRAFDKVVTIRAKVMNNKIGRVAVRLVEGATLVGAGLFEGYKLGKKNSEPIVIYKELDCGGDEGEKETTEETQEETPAEESTEETQV